MNPSWNRYGIATLSAALLLVACGGGAAHKQPLSAPDLDVNQKIRVAQSYIQAGRVHDALGLLEDAVAEQPDNAALRNFNGQALFIAGRYEQAEAEFRRTLELDPYLTDAHNNLGALYDRIGRKDEAEREFLAALDDPAYPTPEKVRLNLGLLYGSQGRDGEAIASLRRAVEIDPKYYQAHYELAALLDRVGELEEAVSEYEVAAPAFSSSGEYHYRLGFAYYRLGDATKAREHLNRVGKVAPGSGSAAKALELLKVMR